MKTLQLDADNNLVFSQGSLVISTNHDAVIQKIKNRLLFYMGEWFLDESYGTPWFQSIFVTPYNAYRIEAAIRTVVLDTVGVKLVTNVQIADFNPNTRQMTIYVEGTTDYSDFIISQSY